LIRYIFWIVGSSHLSKTGSGNCRLKGHAWSNAVVDGVIRKLMQDFQRGGRMRGAKTQDRGCCDHGRENVPMRGHIFPPQAFFVFLVGYQLAYPSRNIPDAKTFLFNPSYEAVLAWSG
jgi:hypothetical protein